MAVVYTNPVYPWQVSFGGAKAPSTQMDYRTMLNEVVSWNPDLDPMTAGRFINNYYRKVIDMRSWYGLKLKGQVSVQAITNGGQAVTVQGSPFVRGIGTTWTTALIGLQFRTSFTLNYQTITNVVAATQTIQLDTPYGTQGSTGGYQIANCYLDFGANIKRLLWAVNQQQGWPMDVNVPIESVNAWDVWRQSLGWSTVLATRSASPTGSLLMECWPTPMSSQVFPFEAYQQPPDLVLDSDSMVAWIPADLIVKRATVDAIMHPSNKKRDAFSLSVAQTNMKEFDARCESAQQADNNIDQRDVTWDYGEESGDASAGLGSTWAQSHDA